MGYQYKVDIAGTEYGMHDIKSAKISQPLFDKLSVGNACAAEISIVFWQKSDIPRAAKIVPYCRESDADEWYQIGIFYIDTRAKEGDALKIVAYDTMIKAEQEWTPRQQLVFPLDMGVAATEIATIMGTALDPRCAFNDSYTVDYPVNGYTLRDVLRYIAGAHGGNWIVTNEGKLLLVPLFEYAKYETNYLVTEYGNPITLGGTRLLV